MKQQKLTGSRALIWLLYVATFTTVVLFWDKPQIAFVLLLATSLALNALTKFALIIPFLLCAVLGCLAEIVCIKAGAWSYGQSQIAGIPYWLPLVWGNAAILFYELTNRYSLQKVIKKK